MNLHTGAKWRAAVLLVGLLWAWALRPGRGLLRVVVLDVGQGDSILVRTPSGKAILIDAGGPTGGLKTAFDPGASIVVPALRAEGVRHLDAVVLTHAHDDHAGGMPAVLSQYRPETVLDNGRPYPSAAYRKFLNAVRRKGIAYRTARAGQKLSAGDGVTVEVLWPPPGASKELDENAASTVLRLRYRKTSVLLMADAGFEAERYLAVRLRGPVALLKIGHHGSRTATSAEWLQSIRPSAAAISVGAGNLFGHPSPPVLERLEASGTRIFRTDRDGAIRLESDGSLVRIGHFRQKGTRT
ncbi:MAG: MBL fold metallo-hydrolase [Armatimonadetes bacterium]|nr:MBL fold metallo-hydrolase [Armatimonadota bacterium]